MEKSKQATNSGGAAMVRTLRALISSVALLATLGLSAQDQPTFSAQQFMDQFLFVVTPIQIWSGPTKVGSATGFFFTNANHLFLVTNRHVVRNEGENFYPDTLSALLHTDIQNPAQNEDYRIQLYINGASVWKEKSNVDLVAIELSQQNLARFVIKSLSSEWFPPTGVLISISDEVLIIGYPRGFSDVIHNYPISRIGAVASAYPVDFDAKPFFLVDAHLHPGTSGSPVLLKPAATRQTTRLGAVLAGGLFVYFLGVNSGEVNFGGESSGLNAVWYGRLAQEITEPAFRSGTFALPVRSNQNH
jgi:S1-C subfamily serine protease